MEGSGAWAFDGVKGALGAVVGCGDGVRGEAVHAGVHGRGVGGDGCGVRKDGGGVLGLVLRMLVVVDMLPRTRMVRILLLMLQLVMLHSLLLLLLEMALLLLLWV